MDERQPRAQGRPQKFNDLVSELGDLVETLGLEESPAPKPVRRRPAAPRRTTPRQQPAATPAVAPARAAAVAVPEVEVERDPVIESPAPVEAEALEAVEEATVLDDVTFWVPPSESVQPGGRRWSPAAAMEFVPTAGATAPPAVPVRPRSGWVMTAAAGTAVGLALFALVVSRLDLAHTGGPDHAVSAPPFALTQFRTVSADSSGQVATAPTTTQFPASTTHLFIDIHYEGATPHDSLQLKVIHDSDGLPPPAVVQDHTYPLDTPDGTGTVTVELAAPPGNAFTSGRYTISIVHGQTSAQTLDFTIGSGSGG